MDLKLNVEVTLKHQSVSQSEEILSAVENELSSMQVLAVDSVLRQFKSEEVTEHVESIQICEVERHVERLEMIPCVPPSRLIRTKEAKLTLHIHKLNEEVPQSESLGGGEDGETIAASYCLLPSRSFHGLWETLIFDSDIKDHLLQYARTTLLYAKNNVDSNIIACNRVILLHGPPGTGKTSLCKSLAHKLAIRMSSSFSDAVLVEINTHSLFSKYFSESGKLVSKMFKKITDLTENTQTLVCILIDEVESLTHSRAAASNGIEPSDSIRVVNAVLTHLDILKRSPNVLVLTTSNITGAIDIAFVDRADIRAFIPNPSVYSIYCIYYSCLEELIKAGFVIGPLPQKLYSKLPFNNGILPDNADYLLRRLHHLSVESEGLSGRALRKVPLRVHSTLFQPENPIALFCFVDGMISAVDSMKAEISTLSTNTRKPLIN